MADNGLLRFAAAVLNSTTPVEVGTMLNEAMGRIAQAITSVSSTGVITWANKLHTFAGGLVSTSTTQGIGYATGAGGAVTQTTSSSTGVTVATPTGQITTVALTTAAGAEERFTVTCSAVAATDVVALSSTYNGAGLPAFSVINVTAGTFDIVITNLHASNAFNAACVINYAVIKAVAA